MAPLVLVARSPQRPALWAGREADFYKPLRKPEPARAPARKPPVPRSPRVRVDDSGGRIVTLARSPTLSLCSSRSSDAEAGSPGTPGTEAFTAAAAAAADAAGGAVPGVDGFAADGVGAEAPTDLPATNTVEDATGASGGDWAKGSGFASSANTKYVEPPSSQRKVQAVVSVVPLWTEPHVATSSFPVETEAVDERAFADVESPVNCCDQDVERESTGLVGADEDFDHESFPAAAHPSGAPAPSSSSATTAPTPASAEAAVEAVVVPPASLELRIQAVLAAKPVWRSPPQSSEEEHADPAR